MGGLGSMPSVGTKPHSTTFLGADLVKDLSHVCSIMNEITQTSTGSWMPNCPEYPANAQHWPGLLLPDRAISGGWIVGLGPKDFQKVLSTRVMSKRRGGEYREEVRPGIDLAPRATFV